MKSRFITIIQNECLILTLCQLVWGYFVPTGYEIAYIQHSYLHFLYTVKLYQVLVSNTNNF